MQRREGTTAQALIGGAQDIFNRGQKYSGYLGAGLLLTNDDLKLFLSKLPL